MSAYKLSLVFSNSKSKSYRAFMNWTHFPFLILLLPVSLNALHTAGTLTHHCPQEDKLFPQPHTTMESSDLSVSPGSSTW